MGPEAKQCVCTGTELYVDNGHYVLRPGIVPAWRLPVVSVNVDKSGQLIDGCPAMQVAGMCPHVRYDSALRRIENDARRAAFDVSQGFIVVDSVGRQFTGLMYERERAPCELDLLPGGASPVVDTLARGANCPRTTSPGFGPEGVYPVVDPVVRREIDRIFPSLA